MRSGPGFLTTVAVFMLLSFVCAQEPEPPLTASQAKELKIWSSQLTDPETSARTKLDAAALLLDRSYPQATRTVLELLSAKNGRDAKIALAEAISQAGGRQQKAFVEPLMAMLTGKDAAIRASAGKALLTYKNNGVTELLIKVAKDGEVERAVRLETMALLQRVLDKRVVGALVELLDDGDPAIGKAALEMLPKLTNIYGYDRYQWRAWWGRNKDRPLSEWLSEWAENLARQRRQLEQDNSKLRVRLAKAMEELYAVTPADKREAMLLELLQDGVADVRLVALSLVGRSDASPAKAPAGVVAEVRKLLGDDDARVRKAAATLTGTLADAEAVAALLERLEAETDTEARQAVLTSLGQLQEPSALPAIIKDISSDQDAVAAAAAVALERIAAKNPLKGEVNGEVSKAILERYNRALKSGRSNDVVLLREALLRSMGALGSETFVPVVKEGLKDDSAMIRLAAVNSLGRLGDKRSAPAVVPLVSDQDRGVRQAAIVVLGDLGGIEYIQNIIDRTRSSSEPDAAVRQQARDVGLGLLKGASTQALWDVVAQLQGAADGRDLQIQTLTMLIARLEGEKSKQLPDAHRRLGVALKQAGKPADAAGHLRQAFEMLQKENNPQWQVVWLEWLDAMYDCDVQAVVDAMAELEDDALFTKAYVDLGLRLEKLNVAGGWSKVIALAEAAIKQLAPRLTVDQLVVLKTTLAQARQNRDNEAEKEVRRLAGELLAADEPARLRAAAAIKAMGDQAVKPLLKELKRTLESDNSNAALEKALLAVLAEVAPKLEGYDTSASKEDRLKLIDSWLNSAP